MEIKKVPLSNKIYEEFEDQSETNIPLPKKWNTDIFSGNGQKWENCFVILNRYFRIAYLLAKKERFLVPDP
jgi:hypothetical protein